MGDVITNFLRHPEQDTAKRCLMDQDQAQHEWTRNRQLQLPDEEYSNNGSGHTTENNMVQEAINDSFQKILHDEPDSTHNLAHQPRAPDLSNTQNNDNAAIFRPTKLTWHIRHRRWLQHLRCGVGSCLVYCEYTMVRFLAITDMSYSFVIFLALGTWLLMLGTKTLRSAEADGQWQRGLSSVDPIAVYMTTTFNKYGADQSFLLQLLVVNTSRLLLSFFYLAFNGLLTSMHAAEEWAGFASTRKPLRVSDPRPGQRSTYWLNLPWSYSLPLLLISSVLHWLVSRSLYLVRINVVGPQNVVQQSSDNTAGGFSLLMMLLVLITLSLMTIFVVGLGFRKLGGAIPMVGTSSLAISAACHHLNDRETEASKPLLWGVVEKPRNGQPGHCSLSSGEVEPPVDGEEYW